MRKRAAVFIHNHSDELWQSTLLILVAVLAFGLGRLSVLYGGEEEFEIMYPSEQSAAVLGASSLQLPASSLVTSEKPEAGAFVVSKTGSKYHLPWCPGAQRIKEENKIYFDTKEEAEAAGYQPAGNCKGL